MQHTDNWSSSVIVRDQLALLQAFKHQNLLSM